MSATLEATGRSLDVRLRSPHDLRAASERYELCLLTCQRRGLGRGERYVRLQFFDGSWVLHIPACPWGATDDLDPGDE